MDESQELNLRPFCSNSVDIPIIPLNPFDSEPIDYPVPGYCPEIFSLK